ncbi:glycosyltransferase family 2 protein [Chloroflexota bacterium]
MTKDQKHKFALVVFARNETKVIQSTILMARASLRSDDEIFVVADNCTDDTAKLAQELGVIVVKRDHDALQSKGAAISWMIQEHFDKIKDYSYLVIIDADSRIDENFLELLEKEVGDIPVGQCQLSPVEFESNPVSTIIALSEIIEQTIFDRIRTTLGWSVRLRGTGMVFKPSILKDVCTKIDSMVEDVVISLLLTERKIGIKKITSAVVSDPKPIGSTAASNQRARWFRGQLSAIWNYRRSILQLILQGPNGWSMISALFFKPRWLELILLSIIGVVFLKVPILAGLFLGVAIIQIGMILFGILLLSDKWLFFRALFHIPGFIWMWIKGIFLSLRHSHWLSARSTIQEDE